MYNISVCVYWCCVQWCVAVIVASETFAAFALQMQLLYLMNLSINQGRFNVPIDGR